MLWITTVQGKEYAVPRILCIQSSPNLDDSVSRPLTEKFVHTWQANHENVEVEFLDLAVDPLPHFGPDIIQGGPLSPEQRTPEMQEALDLSDRLIKQLEAADILVIGAPLINFTVCTQLKSWFDYVSITGRTFKYSAPGVSKGLLFGKKAFVIAARGGDYVDVPMNAFDFQAPLLRTMLGFLGIYDTSIIKVEGLRQRSEEIDAIMRKAESTIAQLAA